MTASDYPKCRTCEHYETWPLLRGKCQRIVEDSETAHVHSDTRRACVRLVVEPDFGCILHSELTDQQKGQG